MNDEFAHYFSRHQYFNDKVTPKRDLNFNKLDRCNKITAVFKDISDGSFFYPPSVF
jgi:hypothetical protein